MSHDLRVPFNKPTMSDEEIDAYLEDPRADTDLKQQLLLDVQPQGYRQQQDR